MENRRAIIIILAIAVTIAALTFALYEYKDVPAYKPGTEYKLDSKYPSGLWMYKQLLEEVFCDKHVELVSLDSLANRSGTSLIAVHAQGRFNKDMEKLLSYVEQGNTALISTRTYYSFVNDTVYPFPGKLRSMEAYDGRLVPDSQAKITYQSPPFPQQISDSMVLQPAKYFEDESNQAIIKLNETFSIANHYKIGAGNIIYHSVPSLFTNTHLSRPEGRNHFYHCISQIASDTILIYDPTTYSIDQAESEDYLSYIFSQRSLKTAYFLSLFGMLIFVIFNSKRVQKQIPIQLKNRNTLGEYIDTLTELNYSIGNHSTIIQTMKDTFYHNVYNKYYIDKTDREFVPKFAKKSKIPERQIEVILRRFEEAKSRSFTTDQLTALYHRIQTVYQIIGN